MFPFWLFQLLLGFPTSPPAPPLPPPPLFSEFLLPRPCSPLPFVFGKARATAVLDAETRRLLDAHTDVGAPPDICTAVGTTRCSFGLSHYSTISPHEASYSFSNLIVRVCWPLACCFFVFLLRYWRAPAQKPPYIVSPITCIPVAPAESSLRPTVPTSAHSPPVLIPASHPVASAEDLAALRARLLGPGDPVRRFGERYAHAGALGRFSGSECMRLVRALLQG